MTATLSNTDVVRPMGTWFTDLSADAQAEIMDMVNIEGYPLSDIEHFIEEYGAQAFIDGYYVTWCKLSGSYSDSAIEAFIDAFEIEQLDNFEDAYMGRFGSEEEFAEEYYCEVLDSSEVERVLQMGIVIDWESTWYGTLRHDYIYENGFVFNRNI